MNDYFFFVLKKIDLVLIEIWKIMKPNIKQKIGLWARLLQLFFWSFVYTPTSLLVNKVVLFFYDLAVTMPIVQVFWAVIGVCNASLGVICNLYVIFFLFGILLYSAYYAVKGKKEVRPDTIRK